MNGKRAAAAVALLIGLMSTPASAWDGIVVGKVAEIDVTENGNYEFRVYVGGVSANACGANTPAWGYLNQTDANYQLYASVVLTAYTTARDVTVYLTKIGGFCRIGYLSVAG